MRIPPLALLCALSACVATTRYRLPLAGNTERAATEACYLGCRTRAPGDALYACLARCPVIDVTPGAACGAADDPPAALCEQTRRIEPGKTALAIVAVAATVGFIATLAAVDSQGDCWWECQ